ncbi:MAG: T9SS type A sorting domain-containing protein [Bacteroidetes bacterium]|nr:T9SS type A sorting domain-containing protein [Bacteroidota bacterium]
MTRHLFKVCVLAFFISSGVFCSLQAQSVIWQETFDDLPNGATSDAGATPWTAIQTGLKSGGIWSVDNGSLLARNVVNDATGRSITVNGTTYNGMNPNYVVWESGLIDISSAGAGGVRIFVEISSATTAELENQDYVRLMYQVDGGAWQDFAINSFQNDDFGRLISASSCSGGAVGSNLRIRFEVANTTVNEFYRFNNITVVNASNPAITLPAITHRSNVASGNWNVAGTWDVNSVPGNASVVEITCGSIVLLSDNRNVRAVVVQPGGALVWTANSVVLNFTNGSNNALVINTGGGLGESIGGNAGVTGSGITINGNNNDFPIINNSTIVDIDVFRIENTKNVTLDGIGTFEMRELAFRTGNQTFTNRSTLVTDNISRNAGNPTFTNDTGGLLQLRGTSENPINANVVLNAGATNNTVSYMRSGNQNIFKPSANNYYNLIFDGTSGTKTTNANFSGTTAETINVLGNLTIQGAASLNVDAGNDIIALHGNWTNTSTHSDPFVEGGETVQLVGNTNQTVTRTTGTETFANLVVNKPGGAVFLGGPVSISGAMTFTQGIVHSTAANLLTFLAGSSAGSPNNSSYVDGPVRKNGNSAFIFPTGNSGFVGRIGITAPNNTGDAFTAQYSHSGAADGDNVIDPLISVSPVEHWTLTQSATAGGADNNIVPTLYWQSGVASLIPSLTDITPARYTVSGWLSLSNGSTSGSATASGSVTAGAGGNFAGSTAQLTLGSFDNPMPIVWTAFSATAQGPQHALLSWQTTVTETSLLGYWIERSTDAVNYEKVYFQPDMNASNYQYLDNRPAAYDICHYRLQALGVDGSQESSAVRTVIWQDAAAWQVRVYPNPVSHGKDHLSLAFPLDRTERVQVALVDLLGRRVFQQSYTLNSGTHVLQLPVAHLATGSYFLRMEAGQQQHTQRLEILP